MPIHTLKEILCSSVHTGRFKEIPCDHKLEMVYKMNSKAEDYMTLQQSELAKTSGYLTKFRSV